MKKRIAAMVILYHFDETNIEAIKSYANQVDCIYAFDNSEQSEEALLKKLLCIENLIYITEHQNRGLSKPINQIANRALEEGFEYLITFDQDSVSSEDMIIRMLEFLDRFPKKNEVAIVAPFINNAKLGLGVPIAEYAYYDRVIQSGALHNLFILKEIGGYDEKLFIDQVDFEYCARALMNNKKIIKLYTATLTHNIGDKGVISKYIDGKSVTGNKYSAIRYYYMARNTLYCGKKYKHINPPYYAATKRTRLVQRKSLQYEAERKDKRKAILWGYIDYYLGYMEKCKRNF